MQLLLRTTGTDAAAARAVQDEAAEAQRDAGLSLLQLWTAAGDAHTLWALFEVSDRARATGWLDQAGALDGDRIASREHHFLETT